ncbi:MAG TPA: hypothetical protein RMG45_26505, partial [Polyangiaceae bacterium LLY-WYZ-15_(1-7)]|nr:hypothetical protein [Polyangiaceae bacterium LLY-WYZ-15_(1-7)]
LLELAEAALPPSDGRPLAPSLGPLVEALCARSREDRRARRAVLAEVPQAWNRAVTDEVDAALVMLAERHLAERPDGREGASARVAVAALRHGLESAIVTRPELLEDPRFGEELRALLARYLLQREAWG